MTIRSSGSGSRSGGGGGGTGRGGGTGSTGSGGGNGGGRGGADDRFDYAHERRQLPSRARGYSVDDSYSDSDREGGGGSDDDGAVYRTGYRPPALPSQPRPQSQASQSQAQSQSRRSRSQPRGDSPPSASASASSAGSARHRSNRSLLERRRQRKSKDKEAALLQTVSDEVESLRAFEDDDVSALASAASSEKRKKKKKKKSVPQRGREAFHHLEEAASTMSLVPNYRDMRDYQRELKQSPSRSGGAAADVADSSKTESPSSKKGGCCSRCSTIQWKHVICRSLIVLSMVGGCCFVLYDLIYVPYVAPDERGNWGVNGGDQEETSCLLAWRDSLLDWMRTHLMWGLLALIGLLTISAVVFFPLSLLILSSSFVYAEAFGFWTGFGLATAACFIGASCGAVVAFLRSRYMTRDLVKKFSGRFPIVKALDKAFKTKGLKVFFLLRLSPLIPYNALNYIGGITGVRFAPDYVLSLFGLLPGVAFSVFLGSTGKAMVQAMRGEHGVWIIAGLVAFAAAGFVGMVWLGLHARRELADILAEEEARAKEESAEPTVTSSSSVHNDRDDREHSTPTARTELLEEGVYGLELRGWDLARDLTLPPSSPRMGVNEDGDEEWFWVYV